MIGYEVVTRL